jgi:hypothetical protein
MEAIGRHFSAAEAVEAARDRRGCTYDPELADLLCHMAAAGWKTSSRNPTARCGEQDATTP